MRLGVIFPQTEIGSNPTDVREFVGAVESLGLRPPGHLRPRARGRRNQPAGLARAVHQ